MAQTITQNAGNLVKDTDAVYDKDGKFERTPGLKMVDTFIYPVINNFGVFAISVGATYLTSYGNEMGGAFGKMMYDRGEWLVSKYQDMGLNEEAAGMAKMVTFSFLDGCLLAPFVKLMEDNRENMAKQIDSWLGTKPEDESVYAAEPKQSWLSVLGGRAITAGIVVPVAVALNQTYGQKQSINAMLFDNGGKWISERLQEICPEHYENIANHIGRDTVTIMSDVGKGTVLEDGSTIIGTLLEQAKTNANGETVSKLQDGKEKLEGLFKTGVFEAFYTSVCTAGLYFSSRFIAGLGQEEQPKNNAVPFNRVNKDKEQPIAVERLQGMASAQQI